LRGDGSANPLFLRKRLAGRWHGFFTRLIQEKTPADYPSDTPENFHFASQIPA